jgi:hypothetical protein
VALTAGIQCGICVQLLKSFFDLGFLSDEFFQPGLSPTSSRIAQSSSRLVESKRFDRPCLRITDWTEF